MIAPHGSVGTVSGIINFSHQLSGIAAPIITGYVIAMTGSYVCAFGIAATWSLGSLVICCSSAESSRLRRPQQYRAQSSPSSRGLNR